MTAKEVKALMLSVIKKQIKEIDGGVGGNESWILEGFTFDQLDKVFRFVDSFDE